MSQKDDARAMGMFDYDPLEEPPPYTENANLDPRLSSTFVDAQTVTRNSLATLNNGISQRLALNRHSELDNRDPGDSELLLSLISHIGDFLTGVSTSLSSQHKGSQRASREDFIAELYLIPDGAVPLENGWHLSEAADRVKQGVLIQETRVRDPNQGRKSLDEAISESDVKLGDGKRQQSCDSNPVNRLGLFQVTSQAWLQPR